LIVGIGCVGPVPQVVGWLAGSSVNTGTLAPVQVSWVCPMPVLA
jgi:hypothetical protein